MKKPELIRVGPENEPFLLNRAIDKILSEHPTATVVTLDEVKALNLTPTFYIKAPPIIHEITLKDNFFSDGKSARNKRREAERKKKKK